MPTEMFREYLLYPRAFASTRRCEGVRRISADARSGLPSAFERVRSKALGYYAVIHCGS
jgi:hypothetical protein